MGMTFHHLGLWLCIVFGAIAVLVSFFLIFMHATHYLKPWEQRQYDTRTPAQLNMLMKIQYYPNSLHGPCLRRGFLPFLPLLPTCNLLRSTSRLLRSIRHCLFLHPTLSLCCRRSTSAEKLFSIDQTKGVGVASSMDPKVL